jgi:hypothetical protein
VYLDKSSLTSFPVWSLAEISEPLSSFPQLLRWLQLWCDKSAMLRLFALVLGCCCEFQMTRTHLRERSTIFAPLSLRNLPKCEGAMPEPPKLTRVNLCRARIRQFWYTGRVHHTCKGGSIGLLEGCTHISVFT